MPVDIPSHHRHSISMLSQNAIVAEPKDFNIRPRIEVVTTYTKMFSRHSRRMIVLILTTFLIRLPIDPCSSYHFLPNLNAKASASAVTYHQSDPTPEIDVSALFGYLSYWVTLPQTYPISARRTPLAFVQEADFSIKHHYGCGQLTRVGRRWAGVDTTIPT